MERGEVESSSAGPRPVEFEAHDFARKKRTAAGHVLDPQTWGMTLLMLCSSVWSQEGSSAGSQARLGRNLTGQRISGSTLGSSRRWMMKRRSTSRSCGGAQSTFCARSMGLDAEGLNWRPPGQETNSLYVLAAHTLANIERNVLHHFGASRMSGGGTRSSRRGARASTHCSASGGGSSRNWWRCLEAARAEGLGACGRTSEHGAGAGAGGVDAGGDARAGAPGAGAADAGSVGRPLARLRLALQASPEALLKRRFFRTEQGTAVFADTAAFAFEFGGTLFPGHGISVADGPHPWPLSQGERGNRN